MDFLNHDPSPSSPPSAPVRRRHTAPTLKIPSTSHSPPPPYSPNKYQFPAAAGPSTSIDPRPRDHVCSVCQNRFLRRQDLYRHEVTHSKAKEYICPKGCGSSFGRSDALARHLKTSKCAKQ
ncbi:hypothetical protein BCR33DRAFT_720684 [Rhizoclosmatium globosum]|uniref:C2H2-type domain-containing protein n=1 Tax=Rhizoclosmatium globosum TaxID=329046 RepID=A0A1Y2BVD3_9FUNG|nr:hypothetical protein BCR33DRAFT_720684 [Rhizoclosmatium globosum]|eukprot:ORY38693.1 hypothetical protein BCR33DRAFT_720684 [Rhizoclosmatium globosum]